MKKLLIAGTAIFSLLVTGNSFAQTSSSDAGWNFKLAPMFIWGKNLDGTQQIGPASSDINLDFKNDIFENLDAALTLHFEAQNGNLTLFADYQYADLDPSIDGPLGRSVDVELTDQSFETGAAYQVATFGMNDLHVLGGIRYIRQDIEVDLNPGVKIADVDEDWWDGFIGVRIYTHITDKWTFIGRGDVGTGGSNITWNLSALIDYRFKDWGSAFIGYRWLDIDYDNEENGLDRFVYDITQQGPLAGIAFYW